MTLGTYLYLMVAVLLTIICLAGIMLLVKLSWTIVIKPIIDSISDARNLYWEKRWNECNDIRHELEVSCIEYRKLLRKLGLLTDKMINHIYSINVERKEELNARGNLEMRIDVEIKPEEKNDGNTN